MVLESMIFNIIDSSYGWKKCSIGVLLQSLWTMRQVVSRLAVAMVEVSLAIGELITKPKVYSIKTIVIQLRIRFVEVRIHFSPHVHFLCTVILLDDHWSAYLRQNSYITLAISEHANCDLGIAVGGKNTS